MRIRNRIATGLASLIIGAGLTLIPSAPAHATTTLGGVSVQGACDVQFPGTTAVVYIYNVSGWRCKTYWSGGPVYFSGIDLSRQCRAQYGAGAYAGYLDYNNPYSWRCYR